MFEKVSQKKVIVPAITFVLIALVILSKEVSLVLNHPYFLYYLLGKSVVISLLLFSVLLAWLQIDFIFRYFPVIFYLSAIIYESHGQFFRPNYWLAYIQLTSVFPFIFNINKTILGLMLGFGLIIFNVMFALSSEQYIQLGSLSKEIFQDIFTGTIVSTVIAFTGANLLFSERTKRAGLYQRFIDLGKNMSSIAHDIKGMVSGPCTYIDIVSTRISELNPTEKDLQLVEYLKEDIYSIRDFVMEMNHLVSSHVTEKDSVVKISNVLRSVKRIFKSKIHSVRIDLIGDITLITKKDYINRIIINSIVNSCEAIQKNKVEVGRITVYCEGNMLGIADNSGEKLSKEILKLLNSPHEIYSEKKQGSGLGILLIKDYVDLIGGKFKYSNHTNGVGLEIRFPKNICELEVEPAPSIMSISPET
jgi:signal transduction histidine kinase